MFLKIKIVRGRCPDQHGQRKAQAPPMLQCSKMPDAWRASRSADQPISRSADQPTSRPADQPTSQPASPNALSLQPAPTSANQPIGHISYF
jgi:hypothetical protein